MEKLIKKLPLPMAGLMLGLAATGNLVQTYGNVFRNIFGIISSLILIMLISKLIIDTKGVTDSLDNPVVASVSPTFSMAIMILSTYIKPYISSAAFGLWILGLILHCLLIIYFTKKFIVKFDIKKVFPSYFVVYVGIVTASVTAPLYNMTKLGQSIFWFGFISYLVLLPIVIYRVIKYKAIPEPALPTMIIFAAPASLCLAGYINSFQDKSMFIVMFLMALSLIMLLAALLYMPKMLKLKFYPSYSAFTFPLVISGIAIKLTNGFLIKSGQGIEALKYIVKLQEALAVVMVIYVLLRYLGFLFSVQETKPAIKA